MPVSKERLSRVHLMMLKRNSTPQRRVKIIFSVKKWTDIYLKFKKLGQPEKVIEIEIAYSENQYIFNIACR